MGKLYNSSSLSNNIDEESIKLIEKHIPSDKGNLVVYDVSDIAGRLKIKVPSTIAISAYSRLSFILFGMKVLIELSIWT